MSLTMAELAPRTHTHGGRTTLVARYGPGLYADLSGGLGDHIRVGPQYIPAAIRGTPIVQRGPHGRRFAPLPSDDDPGVRFWSETLYQPGEWTPRQHTTGVMGFRGLGAVDAGALNNFRAVVATARHEATTGLPARAQKSLDYARQLLANFPADDMATYQPEIDGVQELISTPGAAERYVAQSAALDANREASAQRVAAAFDAAHPGWAAADPTFSPAARAAGKASEWIDKYGKTVAGLATVGFLLYYVAPLATAYFASKKRS